MINVHIHTHTHPGLKRLVHLPQVARHGHLAEAPFSQDDIAVVGVGRHGAKHLVLEERAQAAPLVVVEGLLDLHRGGLKCWILAIRRSFLISHTHAHLHT